MSSASRFTQAEMPSSTAPRYRSYQFLMSNGQGITFEQLVTESGCIECINKRDLEGNALLNTLMLTSAECHSIQHLPFSTSKKVQRRAPDAITREAASIIKNGYVTWWGRETYGQAVSDDTVIQDIAKELHEGA